MGELGFNKILGAALGTFLFIFALNEASTFIFGGGGHHAAHEYECPNDWAKEKFHGYRTDIPCGSSGSSEVEGPVFDLGLMLANADLAAGETVLQRQCKTCHTWNEGGANGTGPNLYGVIGKDVAANGTFSYSRALSGIEGNWTYEQMNDWLTNPGSFARGTSMAYAGLRSPRRDNDRVNVMAFLASTTPNAPAFPAPLVTETASEEATDAVEGEIVVDGGTVEGAVEVVETPASDTSLIPDAATEEARQIRPELLQAAEDAADNTEATVDNTVDAVESVVSDGVEAAEDAGNDLLDRATDVVEEATDDER